MTNLSKCILVVSVILFGALPVWAQNEEPALDGAATPIGPRTPRRMGHQGSIIWRAHHGPSFQTFATSVALGQLALYSGGIESARYPVRIQRDYPMRLRLEMQIGASLRVLLFDGTTVRAEQLPPPTSAEIEIVWILATNSIEGLFAYIDQGALFKLVQAGARPEDFDPRNPRLVNISELIFGNQTLQVLTHSTTHRIEGLRYRSNRQDIRLDFSDWRTGLGMQLPYKVSWSVNRQKQAELNLSQINVSLRP